MSELNYCVRKSPSDILPPDTLGEFLDHKYDKLNPGSFMDSDPIQIPKLFSLKQDIEIAAFITSLIAWGRRETIIKNAKRFLEMTDMDPYRFISEFTPGDLKPFRKFVHRTLNGNDACYLLSRLQEIYSQHKSLEKAFFGKFEPEEDAIKNGITAFRANFLQGKGAARFGRHLGNPEKKSSCKRMNMFLRWMVRKDDKGIDFGLWSNRLIPHLICPLDVHTGNSARMLSLLHRKQNDWQAAEELTGNLRRFDPADPVKYDLVLYYEGARGGWD